MEKNDLLLEQWKMASELYRHEDNLIWKQYSTYIISHGILISGMSAFWEKIECSPFLGCLFSGFGILIAITWTAIQIRSKCYHHYRIKQAKICENEIKINNEKVLTLFQKGINEVDEDIFEKPKFLGQIPITSILVLLGYISIVAWFVAFIYFNQSI